MKQKDNSDDSFFKNIFLFLFFLFFYFVTLFVNYFRCYYL